MAEKVKYMPEDSPGTWEPGRLVSEVERHSDLFGLITYDTADVRDSEGKIHEDVTVIVPDKK